MAIPAITPLNTRSSGDIHSAEASLFESNSSFRRNIIYGETLIGTITAVALGVIFGPMATLISLGLFSLGNAALFLVFESE